jgi:hypothetical protein
VNPDERRTSTIAGVGDAARGFGEEPLAQTAAAAAAVRELIGTLLSLEHEHPATDAVIARCAQWQRELASVTPSDAAPRIGAFAEDHTHRLYLDHAFDIGSFNPCFPEYRFDHLDAESATGTVTFPVPYEGPPGLVHGGFLALFFDSVTQHQNCAVRLSGKTRSLTTTYRRPTPILTELTFDIARATEEHNVVSTARLLLDGEVLCRGEVVTVASPPGQLAGSTYGKRRSHE